MHHHEFSNSNRHANDHHGSIKRVYHVWRGNNRFFIGGRLVFGPDVRSILFTIFLIVTPVISFSVFISPHLISEFQNLGVAVMAFPGVFTAYIILLLFLTSGRDPGIIPRNLHPPEPEDDISSVSTDWLSNRSGASSFRPTKDVLINGMIVRVKYCQTCMLYRPPRCSHCSICNNCVERFDHHCPWVGQCIGKRNYVFFFMFVSSTTILCLYVFSFCWVNIRVIMHTYHCNVWKALSRSPLSIILIVYTFIAAWFVGGLTSFHVYLICTNQTTYENFRYRYDGKSNPYNRGLIGNVGEVFFRKIPKSRINFRAEVKDKTLSPISSVAMGRIGSPELHKKSYDVEMGVKRKAVVEGELEDVQSQIEGAMRLERCGTQPRHTNWSHQSNCEITSDIHSMAVELGKEQSTTNREKISGVL